MFTSSLFILLLLLVLFLIRRTPSSPDGDVIPYVDAFRFVDALLDDALHVSQYIHRPHTYLSGNVHRPASTYPHPTLDALRAQLCHILRGRSIFLVGPHETLYQLHSFLLAVLRPDTIPARASCPASPSLSSSCPSHPLCHPIIKSRPPLSSGASSDSGSAFGFGFGPGSAGYEALTPDISSTNSSSGSNSSLLRFL
jgi:hypothetical protein